MTKAYRLSIRFHLLFLFIGCCVVSGNALHAHTQLVSPNGGESLNVGDAFEIEWLIEVQHDLQNWDLWYSTTSSDGPWIDLAMNLAAGDPTAGSQHAFDWSIPNDPSTQAWVRVRQDNSGQDYYDVSDSPFAILGMTAVACDFNNDGLCRLADLNSLLATGPIAGGVNVTVGVNDQYDLDTNGLLNLNDLDEWLALAADENGFSSPHQRGDSNLDGTVDASDFSNWNQNKFTATLRWDNGDFNGDGFADGADLLIWNASKFQSADVVSVPEPIHWVVLSLIACAFVLDRLR